MGTEVLRPQDCLMERLRVGPAVFQHHRRKNYANGNGNGNPNPNSRVGGRRAAVRPEQKKRSENNGRSEPLRARRSASLEDLRKSDGNQNHLMMGQVTILRRGESLDSKIGGESHHRQNQQAKKASDDLALCGTRRMGPAPGMVPKQIRVGDLKSAAVSPVTPSGQRPDVYAGSAFSMSPSPRSLPLPSFFSKKQVSKIVDDSATRDLRRLLRLD